MNQRGFVNIVMLIIVVAAIVGMGGYFALNNRSATPTPEPPVIEQPVPSPTPTQPISPSTSSPFQLNDQSARYYLEKLENRFILTYEKTGERPTSIYVSSDTKIPLENYLGENLIVNGEFTVETMAVKCFKAPCGPISSTVIRLKSISIK